jgi:hypothetical protein
MSTYLNEPTAHTEYGRSPDPAGSTHDVVFNLPGSPRLLQIIRDVLLSLMALLVSAAIIWAAVAVNRAGDAFSELGDTGSTSETCTDPNVPWCVPAGD